MKYLIGLTGYKQSGKDTAAKNFERLLPRYNCPIHILHFAAQIKLDVAAAIGQTPEWIEENKKNPVIRHLLQWYGNDYAKSEWGSDVWLQKLIDSVVRIKEPAIVIIPDVRFTIEADWIKQNNGVIIRVERAGQQNTDTHSSETELDKIHPDWRLHNNGSNSRAYELECRWMVDFIKERFKL